MSKAPSMCAGSCGRLVRPHRADADKWPGTTRVRSQGMCFPCWRVNYRPTVQFRSCERCGHMTRPKIMKIGDVPAGMETRYRIGNLCSNCHYAQGEVTQERVRYIKGELFAYLRSRGRDIPEELAKVS